MNKYYGVLVYKESGITSPTIKVTKSETEHYDLLLKIIFTEGFKLLHDKRF
jgi:hypothetical protein